MENENVVRLISLHPKYVSACLDGHFDRAVELHRQILDLISEASLAGELEVASNREAARLLGESLAPIMFVLCTEEQGRAGHVSRIMEATIRMALHKLRKMMDGGEVDNG